jgi:hypothetical protein
MISAFVVKLILIYIYPITEFVFIELVQLELSFSYLPVRNLLSYFVNFMMRPKWLLNNQGPTVKG